MPSLNQAYLRATTSLSLLPTAGIVALLAAAQPARADCTDASADGQTLTCTGTDTNGFNTSYDNLTINVLTGADVTNNAEVMYLPNSEDTVVTLSGNAFVHGDFDVITIGDRGLIRMSDQSRVAVGANADGLVLDGEDGRIEMLDSSSVTLTGINAIGVSLENQDGFLSMEDNSLVLSHFDDTTGISSNDTGGFINLSGRARVEMSGENNIGIGLFGTDNGIDVEDGSSITVTGDDSEAVRLGADDNRLSVFEGGAVRATHANGRAVVINGDNSFILNFGMIEAGSYAITGSNLANTVFNFGTVRSGNAIAIDLAGGADQLGLAFGSDIIGDVDAGAGNDRLTLGTSGSEDSRFLNFEVLEVVRAFNAAADWSLSGDSEFTTRVDIIDGRLRVNGMIESADTNIFAAGILGGTGRLVSDVASVGTIAPGNSVGTLTIGGALTQNGGTFEIEFDESGVDRLNATDITLLNAPRLELISLGGTAGANGVILHATNPITGSLAAPEYDGNGAATLIQTANDIQLLAVDGTPLVASNDAGLQTGIDFLDTVAGQQFDHRSTCSDGACAITGGRRLWGQAFGRFGKEDAADGNQAYHYRSAGTALGGDIEIAEGLSIGGSLGYANTFSELNGGGGEADIDGEMLALYVNYEIGRFFINGMLSGGLQQIDLARDVSSAGGSETARAETDGWLAGGGLQAGMNLDFPGGWRLMPSVGAAYQHQSVSGYSESGAGDGNVDIGDQSSDALLLKAQFDVARTLPFEDFTFIPYFRMGAVEQINFGSNVSGAFSNGTDFTLALRDDDHAAALVGAGFDIDFLDGVSANLAYQALYSTDSDHAVTAGIAIKW